MNVTGFLEEAPGVKSSTRLFTLLCVCALLVLAVAAAVAAMRKDHETVLALSGPLTAVAGGVVGLVSQRNKGVADAAQ